MENYLPLSEAAQLIHVQISYLNQLALIGKIKTVMMHGETLFRESDVMAMLPRDEFKHLEGHPIGISEAARKYGLHQQTLSRWKDKGYLKVLNKVGQKILVDEADVAFMAAYYGSRPGKGRRTDIDLKE